jgi:hypothetical protein
VAELEGKDLSVLYWGYWCIVNFKLESKGRDRLCKVEVVTKEWRNRRKWRRY